MSYADWVNQQQTDAQNQEQARQDAIRERGQAQNGIPNGGNSMGGDANIANGNANPVANWLHDTFGKAKDVDMAQPDWSAATYGGTPEHSMNNQAMIYGTGDQGLGVDIATGHGMYDKTQGAAFDAYNTGRGINATGAANVGGGIGMQQQQYGNIGNWLDRGPGPSVAEAQLRQQNDQNVANAMSMAASGRGAGSSAAAQQAALFGGIQAGVQTNQQAAILRAQEQQAWRQQQLQGMGMQSDIGGNIAAQGANQQQLGLGYNQFGGNMQQSGNASMLAALGQGQNYQQGFYNMGQQQLANETQARSALEQTRMNATEKAQEANQQSTYQHQSGVGGMLSAAVGALAMCCDPDTLIWTDTGQRKISEILPGDLVWSMDDGVKRLCAVVQACQRAVVNHTMAVLETEDGIVLRVSPTHPTDDERMIGDLHPGEPIGEKVVKSVTREPYDKKRTYDILPESTSGTYWANGILIGSTLWTQ